MPYNAELQMLREFYLLYGPQLRCCFCGQPICSPKDGETFGHRRHTKVWELNFTAHHDDEDRDNNARSNLRGCHSTCHRKYHKQLLLKGGQQHAQAQEGNEEVRQEKEDVVGGDPHV